MLTLHKNECTKKDADTISNQQEPVSSNDTILHGKRKRKENIDEEDEEINPVESDVFSNSTNREKELELPQKSYFETNPIMSQLKDEGWRKALEPEIKKKYFQDILKFLENEKHNGNKFFPPEEEIFNALNLTPFDQVKVVIIGQDPYHDDHQAHGLCFSVRNGISQPPSLKNIFKELAEDIPGFRIPNHGNLEEWAKRGVLLLNATLTVRAHHPNSHSKIGWLKFTDAAIKALNDGRTGIVFLLWGLYAQKKGQTIDRRKHFIIEAPHPSPLSKGFIGSKVFSRTNQILLDNGKEAIDWRLS